MFPWQETLTAAAAVLLILLLAIRSSLRKRRERRQRDFTRTLETALLPRETVKIICPQKKGRWILTNKRLLLEEKGGFHALPFDKIKSVQGQNAAGNRTTSADKMVRLTVRADKDFCLQNTADTFPELAKQLQSAVKRQKQKKSK